MPVIIFRLLFYKIKRVTLITVSINNLSTSWSRRLINIPYCSYNQFIILKRIVDITNSFLYRVSSIVDIIELQIQYKLNQLSKPIKQNILSKIIQYYY